MLSVCSFPFAGYVCSGEGDFIIQVNFYSMNLDKLSHQLEELRALVKAVMQQCSETMSVSTQEPLTTAFAKLQTTLEELKATEKEVYQQHEALGQQEEELTESQRLLEAERQKAEALQQLNANLEHQLRERTAQLHKMLKFDAKLKCITDQVRDSLNEEQVLQTAVQELGSGLEVECCDATVYNAEYTTVTIGYEYTTSLPSAKGFRCQIVDQSDIIAEMRQGRCSQFCLLVASSIRPDIAKKFTILACPLVDDESVLGDLWLFRPRHAIFEQVEVQLVQQVANQCAIAMRQARLYQAVQAQVESLEKLNQLKDDFLSTVSHELRTPVSNMKVAISMLLITLERQNVLSVPNSKVVRYLQILQSECDREIGLINDLLDLQRIEAGVQSLDLKSIQIQTWLPQIVKPFEERAQAQLLSLQLECEQALPLLHTDSSGLERILAELLNNACKYTPSGESITVTVGATADRVQFRVSNSGVEITSSELDRIFDKFYRIKSTDNWQEGGTGLGLALVRRLTEHLGGTLQVESSCNQTTFTVDLPVNLNNETRK